MEAAMTSVNAMDTVFEHLNVGDIYGAQAIVMLIEKDAAVLPSSIFERVRLAAVKAEQLTPEYAEWCERAYGRKNWPAILRAAQEAV